MTMNCASLVLSLMNFPIISTFLFLGKLGGEKWVLVVLSSVDFVHEVERVRPVPVQREY